MGKDENSCGIQCLSTGHSERGDAWLLWNVFTFTIIVFIIGSLHSAFCEYILDLSHRIHKSQKNINTSFWPAALIQCWNHGKDNKHQPPLTSCQNKDKEQQLYHQHHHMRLTWLIRMKMWMRKSWLSSSCQSKSRSSCQSKSWWWWSQGEETDHQQSFAVGWQSATSPV